MPPSLYTNLITKELISGYKHSNKYALKEINESHYQFIEELGLLDKTQHYSPKWPHCLTKDHKLDFPSDSTIRLICPTKSDFEKISKQIIFLSERNSTG